MWMNFMYVLYALYIKKSWYFVNIVNRIDYIDCHDYIGKIKSNGHNILISMEPSLNIHYMLKMVIRLLIYNKYLVTWISSKFYQHDRNSLLPLQ